MKKTEKKIKHAKRLVIVYIIALLLILLITYCLFKVWGATWGPSISINYYMTLAGILPVLLVALFLTHVSKKRPAKFRSGWWLILSDGKTEGLVGFTVGEVACLTAIALNQSMTSLFIASMFGALIMVMITFRRIVYGEWGDLN